MPPDANSSPDADVADAPQLDAPPGDDVTLACTNVCMKFGTCLGEFDEVNECIAACSADLADCTPMEVEQVDACSNVACGADGQPIAQCISAVACVDDDDDDDDNDDPPPPPSP